MRLIFLLTLILISTSCSIKYQLNRLSIKSNTGIYIESKKQIKYWYSVYTSLGCEGDELRDSVAYRVGQHFIAIKNTKQLHELETYNEFYIPGIKGL